MRDDDRRGSVVHDPGKRSWVAHCARCGAKEIISVGRPSADTLKEILRVLEERGWMELEHGRSNDFLSGCHCPDCSRAVRNGRSHYCNPEVKMYRPTPWNIPSP